MQSSLNDGGRGSLLTPPPPLPRRFAKAAQPAVPSRGAVISALAVSDAETVFTQREVLQRLGLEGDAFAEGIFERCGVKRRHLELGDEFLADILQGRTAQVEHQLLHHSILAADALDFDPADIGTVLSSSLFSLGVPTLAHQLVDHYGMNPATDKYHVTGVGCASGVPLMRLAGQTLREHPGKQTLVVAAESMSAILMPSAPGDPKAKIVGSAIFGDGCAAALLSGEPDAEGPAIVASQVHQIGGSLHAVALECSTDDSHLHLARELPEIAAAQIGEVVDEFLGSRLLRHGDISHWLVHPGGRRIIEGVRDALALSDEDVELSWEALADHGNIGTPSIFYVLDRTTEMRDPASGELGLAVTIGPGVTLGLMLLEW